MTVRANRTGDHSPTIYDVAKHAGVSHTTVSKVLNGVKGKIVISEATRDRVLQAITEMNYRPNSAARALATFRTRTLAIALYDISYLTQRYFTDILGGVLHSTGYNDYNIQLATTVGGDDPAKRHLFFLKKAEERRIDGVMIVDQHVAEEDILTLVEADIPFVLVDRCMHTAQSYVVKADNFGGAYRATNHLISRGHTNIVFFCEPPRQYKMQEMISGFRTAISENNTSRGQWVESSADGQERLEILSGLLTDPDRPTALIVSSDAVLGATKIAAERAGLKIPRDLAVIGYGDFGEAEQVNVTSVHVPLREMGERAAAMLINLVEGRTPEPHVVTLPVELIVRERDEGVEN